MRRALVRAVCLAVIVAAVLPAVTGGAAADDVTVTVTVVDRDGERVGGVDLSLTWNGGAGGPENVTTRSNGQVLVDVPDGAAVEVAVVDDQYLRNAPRVFFGIEAEQSLEVPVSLPGAAEVTVADDDGPVADATVRLTGNRLEQTRESGVDGTVSFGSIERGEYDLQVTKPGYLSERTTLTVGEATNSTVEIEQADSTLSVRVVDNRFDSAEPVSEATVDIEGVGSLTTGSDGQRSTSVSVNRNYQLTVSKDGYETVTDTVSVGESDRQVTVSIRREPAISIDSVNDRVVVGESTLLVVTNEYGEPVSGATVTVDGEEVGQTDTDGEYELEINQAGEREISVGTGDLSASVTIEGVEPGNAATASPSATASATGTTSAEETAGGVLPGFGIVAVLVALAGLLLAARR